MYFIGFGIWWAVVVWIIWHDKPRDKTARVVLQALLSHERNVVVTQTKEARIDLAKDAYAYADAMIEAEKLKEEKNA